MEEVGSMAINICHHRSLCLRLMLTALLSAFAGEAIVFAAPSYSKLKFRFCEMVGKGSEIILADMDGNSLKDIVLREGTNMAVFYQEPGSGFSKEPQQKFHLGATPSVIWPSRLAKKADSLLVLTSEGVAELAFTNRTSPPIRTQIIRQATVIPEELDEPMARCFPLTAETRTGWPMVLAPTVDGLQVWQQRQGWQIIQTLDSVVDVSMQPSIRNPGYTRVTDIDLGLDDFNGDGRDDLITRRNTRSGMNAFSVYLQKDTGIFGPDAAMTYKDPPDWRSWLCWVDMNRDGKVDLVKSSWLDQPWFLPGSRSGKAIVGIYIANESGQIPAVPQQVLRKNDSMSALPVVDVNGDGYFDLALGSAPFDSREDLRRMIMTRRASLSLGFFFYRPGSGFPKEPDCQAGITIHVDQYSLYPVRSLREHFEQYVSLRGDFNGDGKKDLLVRERSDQISVYFFVSRQKGFSKSDSLKFVSPEPIEWLKVEDLNGDNVSDVIVKYLKRDVLRVFLSSAP